MVLVAPVVTATAGVLVLVVTTYDVLRTTLAPAVGGGPITRPTASALWRIARSLSSSPESSILSAAGTAVLLATVAAWILLLWAGWTMLLLADPRAVTRDGVGSPGIADIVYYSGFTLFTLGVGDVHPVTVAAKILTPVASLHGLFLVTLAITYLLPVMSAEVARRQQAAFIAGMGGSAVEIVRRAWDGRRFPVLEQQLLTLGPELLKTVERHPTYPVLNYFHSPRIRTAFAPQVAALDEAVTILQHAVDPSVRPGSAVLLTVRSAVHELLLTLQPAIRDTDREIPAAPDLAPLSHASVPLVPTAAFEQALTSLQDHRRRLNALVIADGWNWDAAEQGTTEQACVRGKRCG